MDLDVPFGAKKIYKNIIAQIKCQQADVLNAKLDWLPNKKRNDLLSLLNKSHRISIVAEKVKNQRLKLVKWKSGSRMVAVADDMITLFKENGVITYKHDQSTITALEWADNSILVGHENGKIYLNNTQTHEKSLVAHLKKPIERLFVNPIRQDLIAVCTQNGLSIKELGKVHLKIFGPFRYEIKADCMYWNPVNVNSFAVHDNSCIKFYELDCTGKFIVPKKEVDRNGIKFGCWSPDGKFFASSNGNYIDLINVERTISNQILEGFLNPVCDISWIDKNRLAVSLSNGTIETVDLLSGQVINSFKISESVLKLNQSPFDPHVFGLVDKDTLKIINIKTKLYKQVKSVSSDSSVAWMNAETISFFNNKLRLTTIKTIPTANDSSIRDAIARLYHSINA